jgi:hypothetical protein
MGKFDEERAVLPKCYITVKQTFVEVVTPSFKQNSRRRAMTDSCMNGSDCQTLARTDSERLGWFQFMSGSDSDVMSDSSSTMDGSDCPIQTTNCMSDIDSDSDLGGGSTREEMCQSSANSSAGEEETEDSSEFRRLRLETEWDFASLDIGASASAGRPAEVDDCYLSRPRLETNWEFGSLDVDAKAVCHNIKTSGPPGIFQPLQIAFSSAPHSYNFDQSPVNVTTCEFDSQEQLQRTAAELHENAAALQAAAQHMRAAVKCMRQGQQDSNPSKNGTNSSPRQLCLSSLVESPTCKAKPSSKPSDAQISRKPSDEKAIDVESRTTVLLRRLPASFTRSDLLEVLDSEGFKDCYDFVYMPVDFVKWSSFGYAFINLASHEEALRMWQHFDGFTAWPSHGDAKGRACEVAWSKPLQGLTALVERYRNSPVMHEDMPDYIKPVVFSNGQKVEFPSPTEEIVPVSRCRSLGQR